MKYLLSILLGITLTAFAGLLVAHAQDYAPLAPLPGTYTGATGSETTNLSLYLSGAIKLLIALGAMFSILVAVIGGTQYVASGIAPSAKQDAKDRILNALIGLALVLTSYLILNSINPKLVAFNFMLPPIGTSPMATTPVVGGGQPNPLTAEEIRLRGLLKNASIPVERIYACQGMRYQDFAFTYNGQGCTTIEGLPRVAIDKLIALKTACTNCTVIVTGGAEAGHVTHGVGIANVDIKKTGSILDAYITNGITPVNPEGGCGLRSANHYHRTDGIYVDESSHWHVCY